MTRSSGVATRHRLGPAPWYQSQLRWLLGVFTVLILVFLSIFEVMFLPVEFPPEGSPAPRTIRALYDFSFNEKEASEEALRENLRQFRPVFLRSQEADTLILDAVDEIIRRVQEIRSSGLGSRARQDQLRAYLGQEVPPETIGIILTASHLDEVGVVLRRLLDRILDQGVVVNEHYARWEQGIQIRTPQQAELMELPRHSFYSVEAAREELIRSGGDLLFGANRQVALGLLPKIASSIRSNLDYLPENDSELNRMNRSYRAELVLYHRGDILIPRGEEASRMDLLKLKAYSRQRRAPTWAVGMGVLFPLLLLTLAYIGYCDTFFARIFQGSTNYILIFTIILVFMLLAKLIYLLTNFTGYIMPIAVVTTLVVHLVHRRVALVTTILAAIYVAMIMNLSMTLFLYYLVGGVISMWGALKFRRVTTLFLFSVFLGSVNVTMVTAGSMLQNQTIITHRLFLEAFLGGGMVWFLVLLVLPFFEKAFNITTDFRLRELTDLSHPLLQELLEKAPGTYHHSLAVGNLAGAAAEAVGANTYLARAGGYYHDIGKLLRPDYFMENQSGGESPHDRLPPSMSVNIIKSHVTDAGMINRKWSLPREISSIQREHHGTTMMEFFYYRSKRDDRSGDVQEEFFRYDGPKPGTLESAIVMIADSVEAISRVVHSPSVERAEEIVKEVIRNRFLDNQFDQCPLTTRLMARITHAMVRSMVGHSHSRTKYPTLPAKKSAG